MVMSKIAQVAQGLSLVDFTWKELLLVAIVGLSTGLVLALTISIPVS